MAHIKIIFLIVIWIPTRCNLSETVNSLVTPAIITPPPTTTDAIIPAIVVANPPVPTVAVPPSTLHSTAVLLPVCNPCMDWLHYFVVADDTLDGIALQVNTSVTALTTANCLANPNNLMIGQLIRVPRLPQITATPVHSNAI